MTETGRYIAIDLKSFYASVECVERGLDPLNDNLVVADESRTDKTICLAVSPSLKAYGISGRARLFEVIQAVRRINRQRREAINGQAFRGRSYHSDELAKDPYLELDYVVAVPRMSFYIEYSTRIYDTYLKYIAPEDIHVYSIDEVFINAGPYLNTYHVSAHELALLMVRDVLHTTGITATAGIGTNMYLAKVAMDIVAKHMPADEDGVRIAELDEREYRKQLWTHEPLTDFWRVGRGYAAKLREYGMTTMGDVARCSLGKDTDLLNEALLFKLFGINAELLIDHAWGVEPCTMADIKNYRPAASSVSSGQVLMSPYEYEQAAVVVREMTEALSLDLFAKQLVTDQVVLTISYDAASDLSGYQGEIGSDWYGKAVPKHAHGTADLGCLSASTKLMTDAVMKLYERIVNPKLLVRRIGIAAINVIPAAQAAEKVRVEQFDLFSDPAEKTDNRQEEKEALEKEKHVQEALLEIRARYGKNAVIKGTSMKEGATGRERNRQIGGHKA
ncbi:MAG: DNA methylase [Solobacterium sp.]|nr:DNA methylase [Solobacterium sp.]MBQ1355609.1 DNA methylase [Solobacterium sp.]